MSQARFSNQRYADEYLGGIVHFRLKSALQTASLSTHQALQQVLERYNASQPEKRFPAARMPEKEVNEQGERLADLSLHFSIRFNSNTNPLELVEALRKTGIASFVEPHFLPQLCYVPNDDSIGVQYALQKISAFAAWDISRGDTNTIVGITDTGIDPNHPDLSSNIARNWADPINGIDDDNDGYIDNFIGWDTGNNDNDPTSDGTFHGQHVTGLSSAVADNQVGIAGTGFDCRFIHVKIANSSGALSGAYEGLVYAAEHGCKIVNCSWGGTQYSELNAEIVRYVNVNLNCLVVCGSGNNNNSIPFYPAAYENAFSVGATTATDAKADFSNYGYSHDLFAPGEYVLSTWANNGYLVSGGTSMASPIVAGAAGIGGNLYVGGQMYMGGLTVEI
jgi:subtilisin family serine protease